MNDIDFMQEAFAQAQLAAMAGEVPVGAVLVEAGEVVARGHNAPITSNDPTAHAEIQVLRAAALSKSNYRLPETTLYVTLEPCSMCFGAMVHARIKRLVYGAAEPRAGVFSNKLPTAHFNHRIEVVSDVFAQACSELLKDFFSQKRRK